MIYDVQIAPSAERQIKKLPSEVQRRIVLRIRVLGAEPRPRAATKLKGLENRYRIRVGDYRVIYRIFDDRIVVLVLKVAHRREVYLH